MDRREFLRRGLAIAGGVALAAAAPRASRAVAEDEARSIATATAAAAGGHYFPNKAPLLPTAFMKLPIGSVTAKGWLRHQLDLQRNGLNGRMPEVSDYLVYDGNGWVDPASGTGGEEVSYWLRGFAALGYVTGDARITALASKWIDGIMEAQQHDGWFGPTHARTSLGGAPDMWPQMPALFAVRSAHEATGNPRILEFMTRYFQLQSAVPPFAFNRSWAGVRWGDNIDSILWLYNRTGDSFLIDLMHMIHANSADWTGGIASYHNVNFAQGFREPAQYGLLGHDAKFLNASIANYEKMMAEFGQMAGGGFAGDENARPGFRDPRQGFETCGIVEYMLSFEILTRITGDPIWADRCEELAFNSMPAAFDPLQKGTHYITSANSIQLDNTAKTHGQFSNGFAMQAYKPGIHDYRCCPHNYGMGWPYYTENLWLATADRGLCASLYAASTVQARVGDGMHVSIDEVTDYPYGDTVHLVLRTPGPVRFPLYLRIPRWCDGATVRVNGKPLAVESAPLSYTVINRTWKSGDTVDLHLPMTIRVHTWSGNQQSVSVSRGPLSYSLAIHEQWKQFAGTADWPEWEVAPGSAWNVGLVLDPTAPNRSFELALKSGVLADNPFTPETNPVELRVNARKIPCWHADSDNVVGLLEPSPVKSNEPLETISLIPMGAARLRITSFPTIGAGPDAAEWTADADVQRARQGTGSRREPS
ncbi:MAG: beta-L-arabinofuranosidase domain-containing protein [Capsulimonadaceae bacterium]